MKTTLQSVGLFAGIGGFEKGFSTAGIEPELFCEVDSAAQMVLNKRFVDVPIYGDICTLKSIPKVDIIAAGFPCQDLSQVGRTKGITGKRSRLVGEIFRLISAPRKHPKWLVLENVPFMMNLDGGSALYYVINCLEELNFRWAYRVVDTRAFGIPQRRFRIVIVASKTEDPANVLFSDDAGSFEENRDAEAFGFYWTEGNRGLGWANDAVPTLKPGSALSIPSPPAIWMSKCRTIVTPNICDAERLQGFPANWTRISSSEKAVRRERWRLVGNAISVPVARWLGRRLSTPGDFDSYLAKRISTSTPWPPAAMGKNGKVFEVAVSKWPVSFKKQSLSSFLRHKTSPLSIRATRGFLTRAQASNLRFQDQFLDDVEHHLSLMEKAV